MTTLTLAYSMVQKKVQKEMNWKLLCIEGFVAACFLVAVYAFLINELTGGTYIIKNYEKQISDLNQQNRDLEVKFAETGFLEHVQQKAKEFNFEKTVSVKYIQILDASLARAK